MEIPHDIGSAPMRSEMEATLHESEEPEGR